MKGTFYLYGLFIGTLLFGLAAAPGCESNQTAFEEPELEELEMKYTASEVAAVRNKADLDKRAMAIDGVLSVGISGNSNEDAWIQILCKSEDAIERAREAFGDTLNGVPIKFAISDTIRAQ